MTRFLHPNSGLIWNMRLPSAQLMKPFLTWYLLTDLLASSLTVPRPELTLHAGSYHSHANSTVLHLGLCPGSFMCLSSPFFT